MPAAIAPAPSAHPPATGAEADTAARSGSMFCSISGVCRCVPPTWYVDIDPRTSVASRSGRSERPAPDVPEAATITMSARSARPAASSGASARIEAVA